MTHEEGWQTVAALVFVAKRGDGQTLAVNINQAPNGKWYVVGLQADIATGVGVLDKHAHQAIGSYRELQKAMRAAVHYAKDWRLRGDDLEKCACDDMGTNPIRVHP